MIPVQRAAPTRVLDSRSNQSSRRGEEAQDLVPTRFEVVLDQWDRLGGEMLHINGACHLVGQKIARQLRWLAQTSCHREQAAVRALSLLGLTRRELLASLTALESSGERWTWTDVD